jgi:hypothetical protein
MALRILKLLDFQPRMGTITRTFAAAAPDLFHFLIVWMLLFLSFAFLAHIVFGRLVDQVRMAPFLPQYNGIKIEI